MEKLFFWICKILPCLVDFIFYIYGRRPSKENATMRTLVDCPTEEVEASTEMYHEVVTNESGATTRDIYLDAPDVADAKGLRFVWTMSSSALSHSEVTVNVDGSIFGDDASCNVTKDTDANTLTLRVDKSNCSGVLADGYVASVHLANLTSAEIASITDGGDVIIVIVSNI